MLRIASLTLIVSINLFAINPSVPIGAVVHTVDGILDTHREKQRAEAFTDWKRAANPTLSKECIDAIKKRKETGVATPPVLLAGEFHTHEYCLVRRDTFIRSGFTADAPICVAWEGLDRKTSLHDSKHVVGIEEPHLKNLMLLGIGYESIRNLHEATKRPPSAGPKPDGYGSSQLLPVLERPMVKEAHKLVLKANPEMESDPEYKKIFDLFSEIGSGKKYIIEDTLKRLGDFNQEKLLNAIKMTAIELAKKVPADIKKKYYLPKDLGLDIAYGYREIDRAAKDPTLKNIDIAHDWLYTSMNRGREKSMAEEAIELYCKMVIETPAKQSLVISMGQFHVNGVKELLANLEKQGVRVIDEDSRVYMEAYDTLKGISKEMVYSDLPLGRGKIGKNDFVFEQRDGVRFTYMPNAIDRALAGGPLVDKVWLYGTPDNYRKLLGLKADEPLTMEAFEKVKADFEAKAKKLLSPPEVLPIPKLKD